MEQQVDYTDAVNQVLKQVREVYPNLAVLSSLSNLLRKPETDIDDLTQLIKSEPALTADIIKISNSSFFGPSFECSDVETSLAKIGFNNVLKLVSMILSQNLCSMRLDKYDMGPDEIWAESVTISLLMETLAQSARLNKAKAGTAGLMFNTGRVIINNLLDYLQLNAPRDPSTSIPEWELSLVGFHYGEAGARFLKEMKFPEDVREIVRYHVYPEKALQADPLAHLLHYSIQLAKVVGHGFTNSDFTAIVDPGALRPHVELSPDDILDSVSKARARFEQINQKIAV